jgi:hypothetical protein
MQIDDVYHDRSLRGEYRAADATLHKEQRKANDRESDHRNGPA